MTESPTLSFIFDLDGLLINTEELVRECWRAAEKERGVTIEDEVYAQLIGRTTMDSRKILEDHFGPSFDLTSLWNRVAAMFDRSIENGELKPKKGAHELLDFLDEQKIPRIVATSSLRVRAHLKLDRAGLLHRLPRFVGGDDVKHGKPAPDIFLRSAELLGVHPSVCVVVEDSEAGVRAGHAAGMKIIMVPDLVVPSAEVRTLATCVVNSLSEIPEKLGQL